jgi:ferrous iron transport protein A
MTLKSIKPGVRVVVQRLTGHGRVKRRLMDMGIIPGTEMELQKTAPLGDPLEIKFKGYNLSLRKEEADMVVVEMLSTPYLNNAKGEGERLKSVLRLAHQ